MISIEPAPMLEDKEKWYVFNLLGYVILVVVKAEENFLNHTSVFSTS